MQIVIDIPEYVYTYMQSRFMYQNKGDERLSMFEEAGVAIKDGTPLPDGAEILTKEAYSDLCTRVADVPENARKRTLAFV